MKHTTWGLNDSQETRGLGPSVLASFCFARARIKCLELLQMEPMPLCNGQKLLWQIFVLFSVERNFYNTNLLMKYFYISIKHFINQEKRNFLKIRTVLERENELGIDSL